MSAARSAALLLCALCLSACAAAPSNEAVGRYPPPGAGAEGGPALASLPAAAGRVVAVRRIPYSNGFAEDVVLDGPRAMSGENTITVQALTTARTGGRGVAGEELRVSAPSDTAIAEEMDRLLPGVAMRLAAAAERDADGPLGYAAGTSGRLSCVYAWQYLAPARPVTLFEGMADTGALPMSVRVRLCRDVPVKALVELLRGLRVARPGASSPTMAARPGPAGDALDAAMASFPGAAPPREAGDGPVPIPAAAARPARRPTVRPRLRHVKPVPRRPAAAWRAQDGASALSGSPPVPMPGDVAAVPAPRAMAAAHGAPSPDDLPLPR